MNKFTTKHLEVTMTIKFEKFDNIFQFLPTIYHYKQSFRKRFGKGVIVISWLKWGIVIYKAGEQ